MCSCHTSVTQNQIDLYDALAGTHSPVMKPNELVGVRVVESEGPLKGQLELKFEHDLPNGTIAFTHTCIQHPHKHADLYGRARHARTQYSHTRTRTHTIRSYTNTHSCARTRYGHTCTRSHTGTMIPFPGELESTTDEGNWYELHYSDTIPGTVLQPDPRSAAPYCNDYAGTYPLCLKAC